MNNASSAPLPNDSRWPQWLLRLILITAAVMQLARILQVQSATGEVPFLSANDRSRWCTIAALAVQGRYEIDDIIEIRDPKTKRRTWYTIDLVQHRGADGVQHFYSSKPPLLPTLYAGVYVGVRAITGLTLTNDPFFVVRSILILVNLLPLVVLWWLWARWLGTQQVDIWCACIAGMFVGNGTLLTTFVTSLNNHLPAALAVWCSFFCIFKIALTSDERRRWFVICGLSTSFAASNELPALSWVAASGGILFCISARRTVAYYFPALLPVAIAFFAANYAAHGEFVPAYAHRSLGAKVTQVQVQDWDARLNADLSRLNPDDLRAALKKAGLAVSPHAVIRQARREGVYELWDPDSQTRHGLKATTNPPNEIAVYEWKDWYDYPGSYWTSDRKQGVDRGELNRGVYVFHCLVGHHGIFSLTPFWFLAMLGCGTIWRNRRSNNLFQDRAMLVTAAIVLTSVVSIGFYLARPLEDRNYGGVSSGFRWAIWLIPLWLWLTVVGLNTIRSEAGRRVVVLLLAISVFSASFPWDNPWSSPWLMQLLEYVGWVRY